MANVGDAIQYDNIVQHILSFHALTGCDIVSSIYGVGKVKVVQVLKGNVPPQLDDDQADIVTTLRKMHVV